MQVTGKRSYNIMALQRGLRLLHLFATAEQGLPATLVAKLSGLPVSTVHRFLINLESAGFLSCDTTGTYHLGVACVSLGQAVQGQMDIRRLSLPHLQELNHKTRETVHLIVRHALSAVYLEKLDSPEPLRIYSRIGAAVPLHCTAVGKVLLAYLPETELEKTLNELKLRRFTENTVGSIQELYAHLRRVRKDGYACDLEEHEPHIRCIAAPIWDHSGAVNASLSVTCPAVRLATARIRHLAPLIRDAGLRISKELGYEPSRLGFHKPPVSPRQARLSMERRRATR
ncbi:MAG TPA: IclR family transcriptional regulator [Candidatus Dormibacteraeota bacterium]|nr:IclR family transcriptional regulator [Candidatus Dormibacteraeota bacterium]